MIVVSMLVKEKKKKKPIMGSLLSLLSPQSIRINKESKKEVGTQDHMNIVATFTHYVLIWGHQLFVIILQS